MTSILRIRLRTIFLLFFCYAVGLALTRDALGALQPAIETAMIVGLIQQIGQLHSCAPKSQDATTFHFARRFAICWRLVIVFLIVADPIWDILVAKNIVEPPERSIVELFGGLSSLCFVTVLCNSLFRWRRPRTSQQRPFHTLLFWVIGALLMLLVLLDCTLTEWIGHRAVAGIEAAQPPALHRPDVYVGLERENYLPLTFGGTAVLFLFAAGFVAFRLRSASRNVTRTLHRWTAFLLMMSVPSLYCAWHYDYEYHRLSPEMAGAGLSLTPIDLAEGILLATLVIVACAYRLSRRSDCFLTLAPNMADDIERTAFHESICVLAMLVVNAFYGIKTFVIYIIQPDNYGTNWIASAISFFCHPLMLLMLTSVIASLQLAWTRWRNRSRTIPWRLYQLPLTRFIETLAMLAIITAIAIPTLHAFVFTLWLGPWNLMPIFM